MLTSKFFFETVLSPVIVHSYFVPLYWQSSVDRNHSTMSKTYQWHQVKIKTHPSSSFLPPFYHLHIYIWFIFFREPKCQCRFSQLISIRSQGRLCLLSGSTKLSLRNRFSNYSRDKNLCAASNSGEGSHLFSVFLHVLHLVTHCCSSCL